MSVVERLALAFVGVAGWVQAHMEQVLLLCLGFALGVLWTLAATRR